MQVNMKNWTDRWVNLVLIQRQQKISEINFKNAIKIKESSILALFLYFEVANDVIHRKNLFSSNLKTITE